MEARKAVDRKEQRMPPRGVKKGSKRARQYEHIKAGERREGRSEKRAEEIAARAARSGVARSSAPRSTREQLYYDAKKLGIEGRSKMSKNQLQKAVSGAGR
jgi:hypothetical protein